MLPILAFAARELRKYLRQPHMIACSVLLPLLQFVVFGYAIGGKIRDLSVAVVNHDNGPAALEALERLRAVESTTRLIRIRMAPDEGQALRMLRNGEVTGLVIFDPGYSARTYRGENGGAGLIVDNTDLFVAAALEQGLRQIVSGRHVGDLSGEFEIVELFPFVNYIQYVVPGAVIAALYIVSFIGGGALFVDDRVSGRHEGYLATPVRAYQIVAGLVAAASAKAVFAAIVVTPLALWIAGCAGQLTLQSAGRLAVVLAVSSVASTSFLTALTIRMRSVTGLRFLNSVTNMVLFFPSGALYPIAGFPSWLRDIAWLDPFTYVVRPIRVVLFQDGNWGAVSGDLLALAGIGVASFLAAWAAFPRRL